MIAKDLIAKIRDLPTLSPAVLRLINSLNSPDADADEVVSMVQQDAVLSVKLLAICNSAAVGSGQPIASIKQAVFFLGYREIYRLILAISFGGAMGRPLPGYAIKGSELWKHSLVSALLTQVVIKERNLQGFEASVAYTAGLLHDIGKIVLSDVLDNATQSQIRCHLQTHNCSRLQAERFVLKTDHAEVGAELLRQWHLPEALIEAVANHHYPVLTPRPQYSALVHVANWVAHEIGSAPGLLPYAMKRDEAVAQALGVTEDNFLSLLLTAHETLKRVKELSEAA